MKQSPRKKKIILSYNNRFLVGLITALLFVFMAFEYTSVKSYEKKPPERPKSIVDELIYPPITLRKEIKEPPKPKSAKTPEIKVVKKLSKPKTKAIEPKPKKTASKFVIDPNFYGMGEEKFDEPEFIPNSVIEVFPHTNACADLSGEALKECSRLDISNKIKERFNTPEILKDIGGKQGVLMVFTINEKGLIEDIKVKQSTHESMAKAAKNAIKKLPQMTPPSHHGRKVKMTLEVPVVVDFK
ncbi:MAG: energy transducer TonB [Vicingaceae bacterium]